MYSKIAIFIIIFYPFQFSFAQTTPDEFTAKFFKIYTEESIGDAVDFLYQDNPYKDNILDSINKTKESLTGIINRLGTHYGQIKIGEKNLLDTFVIVHYIVKYDRQPLRFEFNFYKPNNEWRFHGFSYDHRFIEELSQSLNVQFLELDKSLEELRKLQVDY
jgi:hypothetical protein